MKLTRTPSNSCWAISVWNKIFFFFKNKLRSCSVLCSLCGDYDRGGLWEQCEKDISQPLQLMTSDKLQVQKSKMSQLWLSHWPELTAATETALWQKQTSHRNLLQHHLLMLLWSQRQRRRTHFRAAVKCTIAQRWYVLHEVWRQTAGPEKCEQIRCHI